MSLRWSFCICIVYCKSQTHTCSRGQEIAFLRNRMSKKGLDDVYSYEHEIELLRLELIGRRMGAIDVRTNTAQGCLDWFKLLELKQAFWLPDTNRSHFCNGSLGVGDLVSVGVLHDHETHRAWAARDRVPRVWWHDSTPALRRSTQHRYTTNQNFHSKLVDRNHDSECRKRSGPHHHYVGKDGYVTKWLLTDFVFHTQ